MNDKYFTEFNHRTGLNDVSHFHVQGNMDIKDVEYLEPLVSFVYCMNVLMTGNEYRLRFMDQCSIYVLKSQLGTTSISCLRDASSLIFLLFAKNK